jgi:putative phosphoesterase
VAKPELKIGVLSDTHNFLDPKIPGLLAGVDHILHAGDIGQPKLLMQLEEIAPVTAVCGNTDDPGFRYRITETVELGGRKFLVQHVVNPRSPSDDLVRLMYRSRPDVVVFGHTHKPFYERIGETLFLNPGYASHSRFGMERTMAILTCGEDGFKVRSIPLD